MVVCLFVCFWLHKGTHDVNSITKKLRKTVNFRIETKRKIHCDICINCQWNFCKIQKQTILFLKKMGWSGWRMNLISFLMPCKKKTRINLRQNTHYIKHEYNIETNEKYPYYLIIV